MATIIGSLRPDATAGEKTVLEWLRPLPPDVIVWPELAIYDSYPDFVILHPRRGVAVLEVKDWVQIAKANPDEITIITREGHMRDEPHPARAARTKAIHIGRKLESNARLRHASGEHAGKLKLPWAYGLVFPNLTRMFLYQLGPVFEDCAVYCRDDLEQRRADDLLGAIRWPFPADLSSADVDVVRSVLYPEIVITVNNQPVGAADIAQEQAAKEGLFDVGQGSVTDEDDLPEQGRQVAVNPTVRLIRGVVGSGKTLVLVMRAKYLAAAQPDWRILVVTYNRALTEDLQARFVGYEQQITVKGFYQLCRQNLDSIGAWSGGPVTDRVGRIAHILNGREDQPPRFDVAFLDQEIAWIKDMGIATLGRYLLEPRTGRGRPLGQVDREYVWSVYENYATNLDITHRYDWEDVPLMVINAVEHGMLDLDRYDAVLVDEAQDFAPSWFEVLRGHLNPETAVMFLSADGVQRIYRKHSWRALGLNVVGRTRILNRSYRNTFEIAQAAFHLIRSDESVMSVLEAEGEDVPSADLNPGWMRHGDPPSLNFFPNTQKDQQWVVNRIRELLNQGYTPQDIAIFHYLRDGAAGYAGALNRAGFPVRALSESAEGQSGVTVGTMHAAKGLEFPVVFAGQIQALFNSGRMPTTADELQRDQAEKLRLLYVAITRARERLYLTYQQQLPVALNAFGQYLRRQSA